MRQNEAINWSQCPLGPRNLGRLVVAQGLKRPELPAGISIQGTRRGGTVSGVRRSHLHPADKIGDYFIRQLAIGRHLEGFMPNRFDQQAVSHISRDYCWTPLTPGAY